jgi:hypothetical protein
LKLICVNIVGNSICINIYIAHIFSIFCWKEFPIFCWYFRFHMVIWLLVTTRM